MGKQTLRSPATKPRSGGGGPAAWLTVVVPCLLVLLAGGYWLFVQGAGETAAPAAERGGAQPATTRKISFPSYVRGPIITEAYQFAVDRPDVLDYMPCYCGCGKHSGHQSNRMCFVKSLGPGDAVVFDSHGST